MKNTFTNCFSSVQDFLMQKEVDDETSDDIDSDIETVTGVVMNQKSKLKYFLNLLLFRSNTKDIILAVIPDFDRRIFKEI
jgi:hypothetical protein